MAREEDVIYRKGMTKEELLKVKKEAGKERVKSHAGKGAFAGFMLFTIVGELAGTSGLITIVLGAIGAAFGGFVGHLEAAARERRLGADYTEGKS
jgi:hypothetical protein